jgi:hypothetical protein
MLGKIAASLVVLSLLAPTAAFADQKKKCAELDGRCAKSGSHKATVRSGTGRSAQGPSSHQPSATTTSAGVSASSGGANVQPSIPFNRNTNPHPSVACPSCIKVQLPKIQVK